MSENIICFGKNYQDHMHELGDKAVDKPVIFTKPSTVLRTCKHWHEKINLYLPKDEIHYECELVFKLKSGGFELSQNEALNALGWYTVGLDMTKRNLQSQLKKESHPWTLGKVFPDAAVIGPWIPLASLDECLHQTFSLTLNDEVRQKGMGKNMLFSPVDLIVYASQHFPLSEGDILFTGTPSGVGKISHKDVAKIQINDLFFFAEWGF